ncbi:hypothetical protein BT69DRAFT_1332740 [Atractiella rhizophila]|nr:hypothetical protein BT69DRAFT_1332740 [Atractiella rhizophila]
MVLQNKHKAKASYRYKKAHGIPTRREGVKGKEAEQFPALPSQDVVHTGSGSEGDAEEVEETGEAANDSKATVAEEQKAEESEPEPEVDLSSFLAKQLSLSSSSVPLGFKPADDDDLDVRYVKDRSSLPKKPLEILSEEEMKKVEIMDEDRKKREAIQEIKQRLGKGYVEEKKKRKFDLKKNVDKEQEDQVDIDEFLNEPPSSIKEEGVTAKSATRSLTHSAPTDTPIDDFLDEVLRDSSGTFGRVKR